MDKPTEKAVIDVPEIRDYQRINLEIFRLLEDGFRVVELQGVERQRLLVSGLVGNWEALVVVHGHAGPDLAAGLDAPKLRVVCQGDADDGAGHSLRAGLLHVEGSAGTGVGYGQTGGVILVEGDCGPRAGLNQAGGLLTLLGGVGNLSGERSRGGILAAFSSELGKNLGHARRGGRLLALDVEEIALNDLDPDFLLYLLGRIDIRKASRLATERGSNGL